MKTPFFSIIIPTLNEELFLPRLLANLSVQTYRDFEIVVVDGNSSDATQKQARLFSSHFPLFQLLITKKRNLSYQRNKGAFHAKGTYLIFFDADVQLEPVFLEEIHKQIVTSAFQFFTTHLKPDSKNVLDWFIIGTANSISRVAHLIGKSFAGGGGNIFIKKEIFQKVGGFDEKVVYAEDYDFTQRVCASGCMLKIVSKPRIIFSMRRYRKEGKLKMFIQALIAAWYVLIQGPFTKQLFPYPMGGKNYATDR